MQPWSIWTADMITYITTSDLISLLFFPFKNSAKLLRVLRKFLMIPQFILNSPQLHLLCFHLLQFSQYNSHIRIEFYTLVKDYIIHWHLAGENKWYTRTAKRTFCVECFQCFVRQGYFPVHASTDLFWFLLLPFFLAISRCYPVAPGVTFCFHSNLQSVHLGDLPDPLQEKKGKKNVCIILICAQPNPIKYIPRYSGQFSRK